MTFRFCFYCSQTEPVALDVFPNPCGVCDSQMREGIILIGKTDGENPCRTGFRTMVSERFVRTYCSPPEYVDRVVKERFTFVGDAVWKLLGLKRENNPLFAICIEKRTREGQWAPDGIEYTHAPNVHQVRLNFWATETRKNLRIAAIGHVLGFHVEDKDGMVLSVD